MFRRPPILTPDSSHFAGNMGVAGLLPALSACTQQVHITEYRGKRVAVDSYVWLHKAVLMCAADLCMNVPTSKYVNYFVARVQDLIQAGVIPVLVFDGDRLPAKQEEEARRKTTRLQRCLSNASLCMQEGKKNEAERFFAQAVDVTPGIPNSVCRRKPETCVRRPSKVHDSEDRQSEDSEVESELITVKGEVSYERPPRTATFFF